MDFHRGLCLGVEFVTALMNRGTCLDVCGTSQKCVLSEHWCFREYVSLCMILYRCTMQRAYYKECPFSLYFFSFVSHRSYN